MIRAAVTTQSPRAYDSQNLQGIQIGARLAAAVSAAMRAHLRTAIQDEGYNFKIHPVEQGLGLTDADLKFGYGFLNCKRYGALGDDSNDDTAALLVWKSVIVAAAPCKAFVDRGTYRYTSLGTWKGTGITIEGENDYVSVLRCTSATADHTALLIYAFESGSPTDPYIRKFNLRHLKVEGNSVTKYIVRLYGAAQCSWENVTARCARESDGTAFEFDAVVSCNFKNIICSTDLETQVDYLGNPAQPYYGIKIDTGYRAGVGQGNSTNNHFDNMVMEGMPIGINLTACDQAKFTAGTSESCTVYSLAISPWSRFNRFENVAFESAGATADITDSGFSNQFNCCYSLAGVILQGTGAVIAGGLYEWIEVQSGAVKNCVRDIKINYVGGPSGGFTDAGTATEWKNLFDEQAGVYIYPLAPRVSITVGASPFSWTNGTGQYVEVIMQTGTVSQVTRTRPGAAAFLAPVAVPGCHLLAPGDSIEVTYSVAPAMSYLPHNGFQG